MRNPHPACPARFCLSTKVNYPMSSRSSLVWTGTGNLWAMCTVWLWDMLTNRSCQRNMTFHLSCLLDLCSHSQCVSGTKGEMVYSTLRKLSVSISIHLNSSWHLCLGFLSQSSEPQDIMTTLTQNLQPILICDENDRRLQI